ncbi:MAG: HAMP domain-containing sensor histidine kinase [Ferruginibacter sp.]
MKLLSKYYRANILATIIVVLLSSGCYYFMIHYILVTELDDAIAEEEHEVIDYAKKNGSLPDPSNSSDQQVIYKDVFKGSARKLSTIELYSKEDNESITSRQLVFPLVVSGKNYDIYVIRSQEETEDVIKLILGITLVVVVLLLLILFIINRFVLRRLWKPFNSTLFQLKQFDLSGKNKLALEQTRINEFNELNRAVSIMAGHVSQEYETLKKFTENASHEMQTPLAIINSKLDLLIQGENINEQQMEQLQAIYNALEKLAKMNQSLLLLTRIENNQFNDIENISLDSAVKEKLFQFDELIAARKLNVKTNIHPANINCSKLLLDILLSNLLHNSIRYNVEQGEVFISLENKILIVSNTSAIPALNEKQIFQRFYRHSETKQPGNGLGLSIVKQICNDSGYTIQYLFYDGRHEFSILF